MVLIVRWHVQEVDYFIGSNKSNFDNGGSAYRQYVCMLHVSVYIWCVFACVDACVCVCVCVCVCFCVCECGRGICLCFSALARASD